MNGTWTAIFLVVQSINILLTLICLGGVGEISNELQKWKLYWEGDGK